MEVGFEYLYGDIFLEKGFHKYNLGFNKIQLPIMLWLNHRQCRAGNLFDKISLPNFTFGYTLSHQLEEYLESARQLAVQLPIQEDKFNFQASKFARFVDNIPNSKNSKKPIYQFYNENNLLSLKRLVEDKCFKQVLRLTLEDSEQMAGQYLEFLAGENTLGKYAGQIPRVISVLGAV